MLWEPYIGESVAYLPYICLADQEIWRMMSPLICFGTIKWHRLERVLRQFGLHQGIPPSCSLEQELHLVDGQGRHKYNWYHVPYIALWAACGERIVKSPLMAGIMNFHDPYMEWYRCITRHLITPPLHRYQIRYHNIVATSHLLVSKRL